MALRQIRVMGDPVLNKKCKPVSEVTPRTVELIEDMLETMYEANGVGLAAPQVGILKRIVVIDVSETRDEPIVLINPEIIDESGEQTGYEGCLSLPGKSGVVTRPEHVRVRAMNQNLETFEVEGDELLARAFCHEIDHLDGKMYVDLVEGDLFDTTPPDDEEEMAAIMEETAEEISRS